MSAKLGSEAVLDVEAIVRTIALDNPDAALRFLDRLGATLAHLARFPGIGHEGLVASTRELAMTRFPYRMNRL